MRKIVLIQLLTLSGFWVLFMGFQHETIYNKTLGLISDNWQKKESERVLVAKPFDKLTNDNYIRWDAKHYHVLKNDGYNIEKAGSDYIFAFFPLFPVIWKTSHLPPVGMLFINYLFLCISILILIKLFSSKENFIRDTFISLSFPGLIIFFIPYTEATFLLTTTIGIYGFVKNKYWVLFIGLLLASLTRPSYTFLVLSIVGAEFFFLIGHKNISLFFKGTFLKTLPLIIGTALVSLIQAVHGSGNLFKFIEVQKYWNNILSIPHNLRDWSHEGFAINLGVIFLMVTPLFIVLIQMLYHQWNRKKTRNALNYSNSEDYLLILSIIYLIGNTLFIILFRGGSLHCLFRFTLCSPFAFVLIYSAFKYVKHLPAGYRFFSICSLSLLGIFVLGMADYSTFWNFSDVGFFILTGVLALWLFQDLSFHPLYKTGLYFLFFLNMVWTTYLFNTYINDGWIFA